MVLLRHTAATVDVRAFGEGMSRKVILDLCGGTGLWSKPYKDAGYDVRLVTLPEYDVRTYEPPENVYGILAAPPCDNFSIAKNFHGSGNYKNDFFAGLEIVVACLRIIAKAKPVFWALENPANGHLKKWMREPVFVFNPWQYGDNYQKTTALWGDFIAPKPRRIKKPLGLTKFSMLKSRDIFPEYYGIYDRQTRRAITPPGFAKAFFEVNK